MHRFAYRDNKLFCEDVAVEKIIEAYGTPIYIYSKNTFLDHFYKLKSAFKEFDPLISYSVKANSNLSVLNLLKEHGSGFDVVSAGEIYRVQKIEADPKKVVYASVGKTEKDIALALKWGIFMFNVESEAELNLIEKVCANLGVEANVALRVNPDINVKTHEYITTSKKENKFGIDLLSAKSLFENRGRFKHLRFVGIHIHIGSQLVDVEGYVRALEKVKKFLENLGDAGQSLEYLNIGGGLGIRYKDETPSTAENFAENVAPLIRAIGLRLIMEPGRFIAGNSGIFVCKVVYIKKAINKIFVIVDGGMNDLIRPSLYGAYHHIWPVDCSNIEGNFVCDVVGPICESGDFFAKDRLLPCVKQGDLLSVFSAGAYGFVMSSNYNSRPRVAEVMVDGSEFYLVRKRETYSDLVRLEFIR